MPKKHSTKDLEDRIRADRNHLEWMKSLSQTEEQTGKMKYLEGRIKEQETLLAKWRGPKSIMPGTQHWTKNKQEELDLTWRIPDDEPKADNTSEPVIKRKRSKKVA